MRWLRETLAGPGSTTGLLPELKRWFFEHHILLVADRELRRLISGAAHDRDAHLFDEVIRAIGAERDTMWPDALTGTREDGIALQSLAVVAADEAIHRAVETLGVGRLRVGHAALSYASPCATARFSWATASQSAGMRRC